MKSIVLFLFVSLAAFAGSPTPPLPVQHCNVIALVGGTPIFVCLPDPPRPPDLQPPLHCDSLVMVNGTPVFVCLARG